MIQLYPSQHTHLEFNFYGSGFNAAATTINKKQI